MSHPDLLWDLGVILALCLTPFLLFWVRKDNLALYLFAITITYPLVNFNPLVAPLASRFITPWLLYRFSWPLPIASDFGVFLIQIRCVVRKAVFSSAAP